MRITEVSLVEIPLALVAPLRTSTGSHATRTAALVRVTLDDGSTGWGEDVAPTGAFYTGESADISLAGLRGGLARRAVGNEFAGPDDLDARWWGVPDHPMARCAVESAVWDAWCRSRRIPLATALGGSPRDVAVGAVVGLHDDVEGAVAEALERVGEGYRHIKVKIAPGRDHEVVSAMRDAVGPDLPISVDANGAYSIDDVALIAGLAGLGVVLVEQPFAPGDLAAASRLCATRTVKVGLDESILSGADLETALSAGAVDAVNVKPSRLGGLGAAVGLLERCRAEGLDAWVGGMLESGIGRAAALALATHPGCTLAPDLSASRRYFERDVTEPFVLSDGRLTVPSTPGAGRVPSPEALDGLAMETLA